MSRKIYLSTYVINLYDKELKENANLSKLKNGQTFYDLFSEFVLSITKNPFRQPDIKSLGKGKSINNMKSLGTKSPLIFNQDADENELSGFMNSGISGRRYPMHDINTGEHLYDKLANHAGMLDTFFKLKLFSNRQYALFVLERQGEFGIKKLFTQAFNDFLFKKSIAKYEIKINNFLVGRIFDKMLKEARISEVAFTKNVIQSNIADQFDKGYSQVKGATKTTVTAGRGVSLPLRELGFDLFKRARANDRNGMVKVERMNDEYDEVDFELEVNGTLKTIHMSNVGKSLPDYDVTENIDFDDETDEPTLDSLDREADKLIQDMVAYYNTRA